VQKKIQVGDGELVVDFKLGEQLVVFSHGFGVRSDSRGLFTDIIAALPAKWGYVRFDYDSFNALDQRLQVATLQNRLISLKAVLEWAESQTDVQKVHLVGHSMGGLTIASLAPDTTGSIILLAPPLSLGSRFAERFTKRTGATHEGDLWSFPRSDGSMTQVHDATLADLLSIDAEGELSKLALFRPYTVILPGSDEVQPDADYTGLITMPSVSMLGVDKADHDFGGESRQELVELVIDRLQNPVSNVPKAERME
jgi:pimeloyl-ACP methyl ester carboxylesterase